jgi:DNA-binding GntR family transcriptional regulator
MTNPVETSVGETAYGRIRNDILFGVLEPDRKLKLDGLRAAYSVSVSTLRETLNRLVADGFVIAEGQKGFRVAPVSMEGLREAAELRELLESYGLRRSIENGDIDWEGRVVAAQYKLASMEARMIEGKDVDIQQWKNFDREFHTALISACGSAALERAYNAAYDHFLRFQVVKHNFRGEQAAKEHEQLVRFALNRDAEGAVRAVAEHIRRGVEHATQTGI